MNIVSTEFSLERKALEIYVSGCSIGCPECHNPELQDPTKGSNYQTWIKKIVNKVMEFDILIENIWLLGGEPLDQDPNCLLDLLFAIRNLGKPLWLFTGYSDINSINKDILHYLDFIKLGPYIACIKTENNIQHGVKLASSNQEIIDLRGKQWD